MLFKANNKLALSLPLPLTSNLVALIDSFNNFAPLSKVKKVFKVSILLKKLEDFIFSLKSVRLKSCFIFPVSLE